MLKLLAFLFSAGSAFPQIAADPPIRNKCKPILLEGLNHFYNGRHDKADRKFDEYRNCDPADPIGDWRKALNWYARVRVAENGNDTPRVDRGSYAAFVKLVKEGLQKAEAKVAKGESPDYYRFAASGLYSVWAVMSFSNDHGWFYLKSANLLDNALAYAARSSYPDARAIVGAVNYRASNSWLGSKRFPHDRCGGLGLIQSAEKGNEGIFSDDIRLMMVSFALAAKGDQLSRCGEYQPRISPDLLFLKYPNNESLRKFLALENK